MTKVPIAQATERKFGVLFTNHKPESCQAALTKNELSQHLCLQGHDVRSLMQQEHSPFLDDVGIEILADCRQPSCPHHT